MSGGIIRVAMWSGPRNISTAMMRAWENRQDTAVVDEPFYACYLHHTGIVHPMQDEILDSQSTDWDEVIRFQLQSPLDEGQTIQYQKHMTHHMVAEINHEWFATLKHAFLIRHPADVVASYSRKRGTVTAQDIGFSQQRELFDMAQSLGLPTPVVESSDVLKNPREKLTKLCAALQIPFDENMLAWPTGRRDSDGAWAPHWYNKVEASSGFAQYQKKNISLTAEQQAVVEECMDDYHALSQFKL